MKIEIPDELAKEIGIHDKSQEEIIIEAVEMGDRIPVEVTESKYPKGLVIYVKED